MNYHQLTFEQPDFERFPNLKLAFHAMNKGGNMPCIMNAANEVVVEAFLKEKISFTAIPELIEDVMLKASFISKPTLEEYAVSDEESRNIAFELIKK